MSAELIKTGSEITDAVANLNQLINNYKDKLELRDIYNYDEMFQISTPSLAIVFVNAIPISKALGNMCNVMDVKVKLYMYLEALSLRQVHFSHLERLGLLVKILWNNRKLYNLCNGGFKVESAQLIGRRLASDIFLTSEVELLLPIRFCGLDE